VGIDYSLEAIERAKTRQVPNCSFAQSDYREFTPTERFPVIVLNESLYYVEDLGACSESLRVPDGRGRLHHLDVRHPRDQAHLEGFGVNIRDA